LNHFFKSDKMWIEVENVEKENRRELVLHGKQIQNRIQDDGIDMHIFKLDFLNFLDISEAGLKVLPTEVGNLVNLTQLVLKGDSLTSIPDTVSTLTKLKLLDLSKNYLSNLPDLSGMEQLSTLNLSLNKFIQFPDVGIEKCTQLSYVDLSVNDLTDISTLEQSHLPHLVEMNLNRNSLPTISGSIKENWPALRKLNLSDNKIKQLPSKLGELSKLKDLSIVNNPLLDNKLKRICSQKSSKTVMEYIKQHGTTQDQDQSNNSKSEKSGKKSKKEVAEEIDSVSDRLSVLAISDQYPVVYVDVEVKDVRPFIVICFINNVDLTGENFRKFLRLQTKLHKEVCGNRTLATIATHDLAAVKPPLKYTARQPDSLLIQPLDGSPAVSATKLVERLHNEAEAIRKEKKRNQVSGIHQYLPMLEKYPAYPCLVDCMDRVISFPPVTNSGLTKISEETTELLVEVTSCSKLSDAKTAADTLLREMLQLGLCKRMEDNDRNVLTVQQGRVLDHEGTLKVTYPSKTDLVFQKAEFIVERC